MSRRVYLSHLDMPKGDFRYWHFSDMPLQSPHVGYWGINGRRSDIALGSEFDIRDIRQAEMLHCFLKSKEVWSASNNQSTNI